MHHTGANHAHGGTHNTHHDLDPAALRGAALAFHKRKPSAPPSPSRSSTNPIDNGARAAATLSAQSTGGSTTGLPDMDANGNRNIVAARLQALGQHANLTGGYAQPGQQQFLQPPLPSSGSRGSVVGVDPKSPSFIAATLAASRSASPSPKARTPRRRISVGGMSIASNSTGTGEAVDADPIAPTGSLISMFEGDKGPVNKIGGGPSAGLDTGRDISPARTIRQKSKHVPRRSLTPPPPPKPAMDDGLRRQDTVRKVKAEERPPSPARTVAKPSKPLVLTPPPKTKAIAAAQSLSQESTPKAKTTRSPVVDKPAKPSISTPPPKAKATTALSVEPTRNGDGISSPTGSVRPEPAKPKTTTRSLTPPPKPSVEKVYQPQPPVQKPRVEDIPPSKPTPPQLDRKLSKPPKPSTPVKAPQEPSTRAIPPTNSPRQGLSPTRRSKAASISSGKKEQPKLPNLDTQNLSKPVKPPLKPPNPSSPPQPIVSRSETEILSPKPTRVAKPQLPPPTPPQYQKTISRETPQSIGYASPGDPQKKDTPKSQSKARPPTPPKPRGSVKLTKKTSLSSPRGSPRADGIVRSKTGETTSPTDVFVSAPTSPETEAAPPLPVRRQSTNGPSPSPARLKHTRNLSHTRSSHNLGLDSLTSAIMAGSLASSRLTPSNTGSSLPPMPHRQKSPRLRQTMRTPANDSDNEDDRHNRGHHRHKLRSGKHKHHEGARKKWREEIRPRERKRYEAVWASNRGHHLPVSQGSAANSLAGSKSNGPDYNNSVANVMVREIWRRSRLPEDELMEVWDLVDREKRGMLGRQEFVVGMWLIDQRLKGRKIPPKVSNSVWGSANGVQVMGPKGK